jgi:hypothetical protein
MKHKLITLILGLLFSGILNAQKLSFAEIVKLRSLKSDEISDILLNKGWTYMGSKDIHTMWAFNPKENQANSWVTLKYDYNRYYKNSLIYQSSQIEYISPLKKELLSLSFKKNEIINLSNKIITNYSNNNYDVVITIYSERDDDDDSNKNYFTIELIKLPPLSEKIKEERIQKQVEIERTLDKIILDFFNSFAEEAVYISEHAQDTSSYNPYTELIEQKEQVFKKLKRLTVIKETALLDKPFPNSYKYASEQEMILLNKGDTVRIYNDKDFGNYALVVLDSYQYGYVEKNSLKYPSQKKNPAGSGTKKK